MGKWLSIFSFCFVSLLAVESFAQKTDPFQAGVDALRAEQYDQAKTYLQRAKKESDDPRVDYYLGFAHEKLAECSSAKTFYRAASQNSNSAPALVATAKKALDRFEARCKTETVPVRPQTRIRTGWVVVGTILAALGVATVIAVPIKDAFDRGTANDAELYFENRYGCDLDFGAVSGCDLAELESDPLYRPYQDKVSQAKFATKVVLVTGISAITVGGIMVLGGLLAGIPSDQEASRSQNLRWAISPHSIAILGRF